jgi:hypothetical protein
MLNMSVEELVRCLYSQNIEYKYSSLVMPVAFSTDTDKHHYTAMMLINPAPFQLID